MRIGFIGLGTMGQPMARHLLRGGHQLALYARRPETLQPFLDEDVQTFKSPAEVAAVSDVVVLMVTATCDVEELLFSDAGVVTGAKPGMLVIDMSTISPEATSAFAVRLAANQLEMLDAPVSGGPNGAKQATLTIMVGGHKNVFERVQPIFSCLGTNIVHVGDHGAGQVVKACHQLLLLVTAEGVAESLALAQNCGVDPGVAHQVMMSGIASSRVLDLFGNRMVARQFDAGIPVRLYRKDLQIVLDLAKESGAKVPGAILTMDHLSNLASAGHGDTDLSVLITALEQSLSRE